MMTRLLDARDIARIVILEGNRRMGVAIHIDDSPRSTALPSGRYEDMLQWCRDVTHLEWEAIACELIGYHDGGQVERYNVVLDSGRVIEMWDQCARPLSRKTIAKRMEITIKEVGSLVASGYGKISDRYAEWRAKDRLESIYGNGRDD
jgi:hypothetical protein